MAARALLERALVLNPGHKQTEEYLQSLTEGDSQKLGQLPGKSAYASFVAIVAMFSPTVLDTCDPANRLKVVAIHPDPGSQTLASYTYAGDGLRRTEHEPGKSLVTLIWDGDDMLGEV